MSVLVGAGLTYWCDVRYNLIDKLLNQSEVGLQYSQIMSGKLWSHILYQKDHLTPLHVFVTFLSGAIFIILIYKTITNFRSRATTKREEEADLA